MLSTDQLKAAQAALDFRLEHDREDMTESERATAKAAYNALDPFIDGDSIASVWSIEDVFSLMFPDEDGSRGHHPHEIATARKVLAAADHNHDATIGINWDVLWEHLSMVLEEESRQLDAQYK